MKNVRPVKIAALSLKVMTAMITLISGGLLSPAAQASLDESVADTGRARMSHGDWDGAVQSFNEAIGLTAGSSNLYFLRGQSFYHMKSYDLALGDFDHAIQLDASNSDALTWRGTTQSKLGHDDLAVRDFAQAIRVNPQLAKNYFAAKPQNNDSIRMVGVRSGAGNTPYQPYDSRLSITNGSIRQVAARGQDDHTIGLYTQAMTMVYPEGLNGSAKLPAETSSTTETKTSSNSDKAGTEKTDAPSNTEKSAHKKREKTAKELDGMQKEATKDKLRKEVSDYSEAIRRDGSNAADYFHRGRCYQKLDSFDSAIADFSSAISLSPQNSQFYLARAAIYVLMKKPLMAKADIESAHSVDPTLPDKVELNLEH